MKIKETNNAKEWKKYFRFTRALRKKENTCERRKRDLTLEKSENRRRDGESWLKYIVCLSTCLSKKFEKLGDFQNACMNDQ